jgi:hypothetical protein
MTSRTTLPLLAVILASGADLDRGFLDVEVVEDQGPEFATLLEQRFAAGEVVAAPPRGRLIPLT